MGCRGAEQCILAVCSVSLRIESISFSSCNFQTFMHSLNTREITAACQCSWASPARKDSLVGGLVRQMQQMSLFEQLLLHVLCLSF